MNKRARPPDREAVPAMSDPAVGCARKLFGTARERREGAVVALAMLTLTTAYAALSAAVLPGYRFDALEFAGTWTGLVCVWLSRTENILCWPWGIASVLCFGAFFGRVNLPGQQWLNWGFFLAIQLWAWPNWLWGGRARTELRIGSLDWRWRLLVIIAVALGAVLVHRVIDTFTPASIYPWLDATVVSASVVAQILLGAKKVESWAVWLGPVNLLSIVLFAISGAYLVMALYIAFFVHAAAALIRWRRLHAVETL